MENKILSAYHKASKTVANNAMDDLTPDEQAESLRFATEARELLSRCLLRGDPRSLVYLLDEIRILLLLVGDYKVPAQFLAGAITYLSKYIAEHGEL